LNSILAIPESGDFVGRIDLPMPELGRGTQFLEASADELQAKIRSKVPKQYRSSVVVRPFKRRGSTGLSVEYEDIIEAEVMSAIEGRFG